MKYLKSRHYPHKSKDKHNDNDNHKHNKHEHNKHNKQCTDDVNQEIESIHEEPYDIYRRINELIEKDRKDFFGDSVKPMNSMGGNMLEGPKEWSDEKIIRELDCIKNANGNLNIGKLVILPITVGLAGYMGDTIH